MKMAGHDDDDDGEVAASSFISDPGSGYLTPLSLKAMPRNYIGGFGARARSVEECLMLRNIERFKSRGFGCCGLVLDVRYDPSHALLVAGAYHM